jgi:hypothetical protein
VLWSYFKAPTNLLFVTTNLIGLGIITTYRGLNTLANTDLNDFKPDSTPITVDSIRSGIEWKNHNNKIYNWEHMVQIENKEEAVTDDESSAQNYFPVTEEDLLAFGPDETADLPRDRLMLLISEDLLELGTFYKKLKHLVRSEKNYDKAFALVNEKTKMTKDQAYQHHLEQGTLYDFYRKHHSLRNRLFSGINQRITYDYMERNRLSKEKQLTKAQFQSEFKKQINQFKSVNTLQDKFLLRMSKLFASYNDPDMLGIFKELNSYDKNENFKTLLNVLSLSIIRQSTAFIRSEAMFYEILRNSIISTNKLIFEKCLSVLNLTESDLERMNFSKSANKLIRRIAKGNKLNEYSYSLKTYLYAAHGLLRFNYSWPIVKTATKKIIASLQTMSDGEFRVTYTFVPSGSQRKGSENKKLNNKSVLEKIPVGLIDFSTKVALKTEDRFIWTWCVLAISKNSTLESKDKVKRLHVLKRHSGDEEMKHVIEQLLEIIQNDNN